MTSIPSPRVLIAVAPIALAACVQDPVPAPERHPLVFETLVAPAQVSEGSTEAFAVSYRLGPDSCWRLESLTVDVQGRQVVVGGTAIDPRDPDWGCYDTVAHGSKQLQLPALGAGNYVIVAGDLSVDLTVVQGPPLPGARAAFLGSLSIGWPQGVAGGGCAWGYGYWGTWLFSDVPANLSSGDYLVIGDVTTADPCGVVDLFGESAVETMVAVASMVPTEL